MSLNVLVTAPYMLGELERFRDRFARAGVTLVVARVQERLEEGELLPLVGQADGIICGDDRFTERVLQAAVPRLKVIAKWGTGIDSIDLEAAARLGVRVCNTSGAFTQPVADTTLGYILVFARRLADMTDGMRRGEWDKLPSVSLLETTVGIIGVGNIGSAVARRAKAFGMRILGNDIKRVPPAVIAETGLQPVPLNQLLTQSDFVTLHCDLNLTSLHLMNGERLALMRSTAFLINTARGPVVDEAAVVDALEHGRIAGAALDVFEWEPLPPDSPLRRMSNVLLAPHNANSSPLAWDAVHESTIRQLFEGLGIPSGGSRPENVRQP